ncbi:MAG: hypothetical protein M3340_06425 [Actinomycetota bacterium]|nr:hypothetical protein [Actinomycetota bacterium]
MKKRITTVALLCASLVLPASAGAQEPDPANFKNAAKYCKALRAASGETNFRNMFGGKKNAYGKCVSKAARRDAKQEDTAKSNAAKECKAEQSQNPDDFKAAHGGKTFAEFYGTNKGGKNAYGKCVSQKAKANKAEADEQEQEDVNSAKECRAEQKQNPDDFKAAHGGKTFAEFYGTNENGKNAFGKCVSSKSKAKREEQASTTS